jgi:hypothetical protein
MLPKYESHNFSGLLISKHTRNTIALYYTYKSPIIVEKIRLIFGRVENFADAEHVST